MECITGVEVSGFGGAGGGCVQWVLGCDGCTDLVGMEWVSGRCVGWGGYWAVCRLGWLGVG